MKKSIIFCLTITLLFCLVGCQKNADDGPFTKQGFYLISAVKDKNGTLEETYDYNSDGTLAKVTYYSYGNARSDARFFYDENANLIESQNGSVIGSDYWKHKYAYDENNNLIRHSIFENGSSITHFNYEYDQTGKLLKNTTLNQLSHYYELCDYDSNGNLIQKTQYGYITNEKGYHTTYEYDTNGALISETFFFEDGQTGNTTKYTYDNSNRLTSETTYEDGTIKKRYTYTYDRDGNITSETTYNNGNLYKKIEYSYEYDRYGCTVTLGTGETIRYTKFLLTEEEAAKAVKANNNAYIVIVKSFYIP